MKYFIIVLGILAALLLLLNYWVAASARESNALPYQITYVPAEYAPIEQQLLADMGVSSVEDATLFLTSGNFYDFAVGPIDGGGTEVIAYRKADGHFEVIWQGQDEPNCAIVVKANILANIVPECIWMDARIDRGTILGFFKYLIISFSNR